ncbi:alpha/beta hydrolase [Cupriavidus gilardii]|uniref:alpha/beta hydrolase n=1 Tax=Cupriavidus gilardii TaxID=82541 RepID=UPI001580D887|nr:alpha/beta hydrolase [Cupriavidus gilardii]MCT9069855.1 alpha/beta fold hydrolase [Cupriavidus gilardii]QKS62137.1 alpha/beta fold hydrolase [Cupriavidus gilardii]
MKRVAFDRCVGWLHPGPGATGVVLCAPWGHEAMWSHRAWRHLADDLASAGMPVLRFDYPGCGDSAGSEDGPDRLGICAHSIVRAAQTLRAHTGVERVVLCGLRLGATLAVLAAEAMAADGGQRADGLILLAPPVTGRGYLRELRALQSSWCNNAIPDIPVAPPGDGACEVLGYRLPSDAVALLESLRLERRAVCPAPRMLLLDAWPGAGSPVAALAGRYRAHGAQVTRLDFDEYPAMMRSAENSSVPEQAWQQIAQWLGPAASVARRGRPSSHVAGDAVLRLDAAVEQPVWLDGGRQFGLLCTPGGGDEAMASAEASATATAVLFPNTGGNHHVGDCRLFVTLSRQLAAAGVAALRLDVSALGDSPLAARTMRIAALYGEQPARDVAAAVAWLRARGYRRVVVGGVCSGGFIALQAALAGAAIDGLVLANLLKFRWDGGDGADGADNADAQLQSTRVYLAAARNPAQWLRLLRGEIDPWPHAAALARRLFGGRARGGSKRGANDLDAYAREAMQSLQRRGVRVDLLYGAGDIGLEEARSRFGRHLEALAQLSGIRTHVLPRLDHSLFLAESRAQFAACLMRHLAAFDAPVEMASAMPPATLPATSPSTSPALRQSLR